MYKRKVTFKKSKPKPKPKVVYMTKAPVTARQIELKHHDVNISQNILASGTLNLLSNIGQGVSDFERIGIRLTLKSLTARLLVRMVPSVDYEHIRLIFFLDKQGMNTPSVTDILESALVGGVLAPMSQYEHSRQQRFKILSDTTTTICNSNNNAFHLTKTFKIDKVATYANASVTFTNQLYLLAISGQLNILTLPVLNASFRVMFADD